MSMKLKTIEEKLIEKFGTSRVFAVSTAGYDLTTNPKGRNSKKDRSKWADTISRSLFIANLT